MSNRNVIFLTRLLVKKNKSRHLKIYIFKSVILKLSTFQCIIGFFSYLKKLVIAYLLWDGTLTPFMHRLLMLSFSIREKS